MEFIRVAKKLGNSAGVLLPKKLLGAEIKITVVARPVNPKKESLKLISEYLEDVLGMYVINSKPVEVLVISSSTRYLKETNRIKVIIMPISLLRKEMKTNFILRSKLFLAKTIMNKSLLQEIQKEARNFK